MTQKNNAHTYQVAVSKPLSKQSSFKYSGVFNDIKNESAVKNLENSEVAL